jgi:hypothetical protein
MAHHSLSALGEQIACVRALTRDLLAAGTGDNSEVDGEDIDRFVNGTNASGGIFGSVVFAVTARAVLTDKKTLVVKATLQESADGSTFTDVAAALQPSGAADSTILTLTSDGGTTEVGIAELALDCSSLERYVRIQLHCDLNASGTDVADVHCVAVKGGSSTLPV